jgi:hypothetical protein
MSAASTKYIQNKTGNWKYLYHYRIYQEMSASTKYIQNVTGNRIYSVSLPYILGNVYVYRNIQNKTGYPHDTD